MMRKIPETQTEITAKFTFGKYFQGTQIFSNLVSFQSEMESTQTEEFAPLVSKFIPFKVDTFSEGNYHAGKQTVSNSISLVKKKKKKKRKKQKNLPCVSSPIKKLPKFLRDCLLKHFSYKICMYGD